MSNSAIHKAAGSLVTSRSLPNGKMSMGNRHTERSPEVVLYGGRKSGGFVNSAVRCSNSFQVHCRVLRKLWEFNVTSHVCLSVHRGWSHVTITHHASDLTGCSLSPRALKNRGPLNGPKHGTIQSCHLHPSRSPTEGHNRCPIRLWGLPANDTCHRCIFKALYSTVQ